MLEDVRIRAFMKKVRHVTNPRSEQLRHHDIEVQDPPYLSHRLARVVIKARGRTFERSVDYANWLDGR